MKTIIKVQMPTFFSVFIASMTLFSWTSSTAIAGTYDRGRIQYADKLSPKGHILEISAKKPVNPTVLIALVHIHMAKVCAGDYYFMDQLERTPELPESAPISSAKVRFSCNKEPKFFNNEPDGQKVALQGMCSDLTVQASFLNQECKSILRK